MSAVAAIQHYLATQDGMLLGYLFGSRARGDHTPASDYDIAVLTSIPLPPDECYRMASEMTALTDEIAVDLVPLDRAPITLAYGVIVEGQCIFKRNRATRVEYEADGLSRYFDALPILRQQRADLIEGKYYEAGVRRHREAFRKTQRMLAEIRAASE